MPVVYQKCGADVVAKAKAVMKQFHPDLVKVEAKVTYLFAIAEKNEHGEPLSPAVTLGGYPCLAKVKVIGLKERADGRADAEVVIDQDAWDGMTDQQQDALLDHELHHLDPKRDPETGDFVSDDIGRPKFNMRRHDHQFGWFDVVARRHGDASFEVKQAKQFADACGQLYFGWKAPPAQSVESLPAKTPKGGIESITLSSGGNSVTLTAEHAKKINKAMKSAVGA